MPDSRWKLVSIRTLCEEGDPYSGCWCRPFLPFLSTPSVRRATWPCGRGVAARPISIHALREEGDMQAQATARLGDTFLSTPSARRATQIPAASPNRLRISIHALREEGDSLSNVHETSEMEFLSTPSARRATCCTLLAGTPFTYFYPRPPRGGRLSLWLSMSILPKISIHALREEGDRAKLRFPSTGEPFLSTPSARRATQRIPDNLFFVCDFYPRPPRGGRLDRGLCIRGTCAFLSTPSARRATCFASGLAVLAEYFYPRPPRGGRLASSCLRILLLYFYPRPPRGGRHAKFYIEMAFRKFLSTPSARRAT